MLTNVTRTVTSSARVRFTVCHDSVTPRVVAESVVWAEHDCERIRSMRASATAAATDRFFADVMSVMTFADVAAIANAPTEKTMSATMSSASVKPRRARSERDPCFVRRRMGQHPRPRVLPSPVTQTVSDFVPLVTMILYVVVVPISRPRASNITLSRDVVGVTLLLRVTPVR